MAIFVGVVILLASIAYVVWPMLKGEAREQALPSELEVEHQSLLSQRDSIIFAISELDSDYSMGNLSEIDHKHLRQKYEQKAVSLLKQLDAFERNRPAPVDSIEQEVALLRRSRKETVVPISRCKSCNAPLDPGDKFCAGCGAPSTLSCTNCGASYDAEDKFCPGCGAPLRAKGG